MEPERRRNRSSRPSEALELFLHVTRSRLGLHALTLGTPDGVLVAGSGNDLERVAELGARVDAGERHPEVATWRTSIAGGDIVVTSWGRTMSMDLGDGVRRILESVAPV